MGVRSSCETDDRKSFWTRASEAPLPTKIEPST